MTFSCRFWQLASKQWTVDRISLYPGWVSSYYRSCLFTRCHFVTVVNESWIDDHPFIPASAPVAMCLIAVIVTKTDKGRKALYGYDRSTLDQTLQQLEKVQLRVSPNNWLIHSIAHIRTHCRLLFYYQPQDSQIRNAKIWWHIVSP